MGFYVIPDDLLLSVVIPVFNEEGTLRDLVERVAEVPVRKEMILVDDCSVDSTAEVMASIATDWEDDESNRVVLERHEVNRG